MTNKYFQILSLITLFSTGVIKSENTIAASKRILNELNQKNNYEDGYDENDLHHPHHYKQSKYRHHQIDSPNLMNVQTMNLFLKPNKRQREEAEIERMLRAEAICAQTGRCGCTGSRCDHPNRAEENDDVAEEVDRVINEINKRLVDDERENNGNREHLDEEQENRLLRDTDDRQKDADERKKDSDDEDYKRLIEGDRDVDDDRGNERDDAEDYEMDRRLRCNGPKCFFESINNDKNKIYKDNGLLSKRIKINDNIDVVILDKSDLEKLFRNEDFIDLTRKDQDKEDEVDLDKEIFQKVLEEYKKIIATENNIGLQRSNVDITPDDLFGHYQTIKTHVISKVLSFVKSKTPFTLFKIKHLTSSQRKLLENIRMKYRHGEVKEKEIGDEIVRILLGEESNMKILAQTNHDKHIYIPKWLYDKIVNFKKTLKSHVTQHNELRYKRILPLTVQQKERLFNKEKAKPIPKLVWRKNLGQDVQKYGIPFDFEIHGLGQMAP